MFWKQKQRPEPPVTEEDVQAARKLYSDKWHYFEKLEELPDDEKEFLKEVARSELLKQATRYASQ